MSAEVIKEEEEQTQSKGFKASVDGGTSNPAMQSQSKTLAPVSDIELDVSPRQTKSRASRDVQLGVIVRRLFNVDTVQQIFGTNLTIIMVWDCPDDEQPDEDDDGDWVPQWTPKYKIRKVMEEIRKDEQFSCELVGGKRVVKMEADYEVNIQQKLGLKSFPVDCQELSVEVRSLLPISSYRFVPLGLAQDGKCEMVRLMSDGGQMNDFTLLAERPFTFKLFDAKTLLKTASQLNISLRVQRKASYYLINVALVMLLICSFSFCAWAVHPADVDSRHGVDFNLILTAVAFKLVLTSMLPPVSYVTLLDMYVMSCFLFLTLVTVCHSVLPLQFYSLDENSPLTFPPMSNEREVDLIEADKISFYVAAIAWSAFNVFSFVYYLYRRHIEFELTLKEAEEEQAKFSYEEVVQIDLTIGRVKSSGDLAVRRQK